MFGSRPKPKKSASKYQMLITGRFSTHMIHQIVSNVVYLIHIPYKIMQKNIPW